MKKYLFTFVLFQFSLFAFSQRYGRMSDVYESLGEDGYSTPSSDIGGLIFFVIISAIIIIYKSIKNVSVKNILAKIKQKFYSNWIYIPIYCIYLTLNFICLCIGKYRKPYTIITEDNLDRIPQTQEECFYPFRHFEGGTGQCEPLYAYDINEFILYGFLIPVILLVLYILLRKLTNSIWLDAIYIFLSLWLLVAFFIPVIFYSDGSECGWWLGWIPSNFLTSYYINKKIAYLESLKT